MEFRPQSIEATFPSSRLIFPGRVHRAASLLEGIPSTLAKLDQDETTAGWKRATFETGKGTDVAEEADGKG